MAKHPTPPPFDRRNDFIVFQGLLLSGREFKAGELLDKDLVTTRRLRQLYDGGFVKMQPRQEPEPDDTPWWVNHPKAQEETQPQEKNTGTLEIPEDREEMKRLYTDLTGEEPTPQWNSVTLQARIREAFDGQSA